MQRLLIVACSATKRHDPGLLPAHTRYHGMAYRVIARATREGVALPLIVILSAELGLVRWEEPIPDYDRLMTSQRARELSPLLQGQWRALRPQLANLTTVHIHAGDAYRQALACLSIRSLAPRVTWSHGGIGQQLSQLRAWLIEPA